MGSDPLQSTLQNVIGSACKGSDPVSQKDPYGLFLLA